MATAVKRQHEPQRIVGDLLNAEISEKHARSIRYQLTTAKLPLAKDLDPRAPERMQLRTMAMARWVLPVPVPPIRTT
jgi:hypothetical protein